MRSYEAARTYFSVLEFISGCIIILGAIAVFFGIGAVMEMGRGFGNTPSVVAYVSGMVPGVALAFAGFLGLVFCQIGRAGVDAAEYGQQSLAIARQHLEISTQSLKQSAELTKSYAALQAAKEEIQHGSPSDTDQGKTASFADVRPESKTTDSVTTARNKQWAIEEKYGKFYVRGRVFDTRAAALHFVDSLQAPPVEAVTKPPESNA